MDEQQQRGPQDAQMQQQGGPSTQQGGSQRQQQGGQQSQFGASAGQQGGAQGTQPGAQPGGASTEGSGDPQSPRGGNPYTDFFTRRGTSPFELLKRLDEDVDRLFHQFIGGGRELLRNRMRERGGMESTVDMGAATSAAGSSGGTDERQTEAAGSASGHTAVAPMGASGWLPEVEVCERNGKLHVYADLPGLSREDLQIHFENDQLVLQGERRTTRTTSQPGGYYRTERSYGQFRRVIPLPEGVNPDTAQAGFHNGVLEICFDMPVRHNRSRQIPIQEGGVAPGGGAALSGASLGQAGSTGGSPMGGTGVGGGASMGGSMGSSSGGLSGGGSGRPASSAAGSEAGPQE